MGVYSNAYAVMGGIPGIFSIIAISALSFALPFRFGSPAVFSHSDQRIGFQPGATHRGTLNIIWACCSTMFICVYVAMHTDVPSAHHGFWRRMLQKTGWMLVGLAAPEVVMGWSVLEFVQCVTLKNELQSVADFNRRSKISSETGASSTAFHSSPLALD